MRCRYRNKGRRYGRIIEAKSRQAEYDKLTTQQKLDRAINSALRYNGQSDTKQIRKLRVRLESEKTSSKKK